MWCWLAPTPSPTGGTPGWMSARGGDFYMATRGDIDPATSGVFSWPRTGSSSAWRPVVKGVRGGAGTLHTSSKSGGWLTMRTAMVGQAEDHLAHARRVPPE